jgi:ABC-2 type transport system permease protein
VNAIGFKTLFVKETRRFLKVPGQTIAQPVITTALYFLVFGFALGGAVRSSAAFGGVSYVRFIVPGLVMLALIQNSFLNTASSMFIAKMQGTIVDLLVAPLSPGELLGAFTLAGLVRGILVGGIVWLVAAVFTGFSVAHPLWTVAFALLVAIEFALFGLVVAIWSDKFEQLNLVPTFVITPLTFLGGVFYSPRMLPEPWAFITKLNPVLYMVEGLRYGIIGHADASPWLGLGIVAVLTLGSGLGVRSMLASGYKLRG